MIKIKTGGSQGVITMKIQQQNHIKAFLNEEFGKDRAAVLFDMQRKMLGTLAKNAENKSKNQMKMLVRTIFPRIAIV